jgi:TrpR-related protein YerC/YecD
VRINALLHYDKAADMKHHDQSQKRLLKNAEQSLYSALASLRDAGEAQRFLLDLCTPAEIEAMVDRWRVAQLLDQGLTYRDISEVTEVSVTTIGRVARFLELGTGGYRTVLDRFAERSP